MNIAKNVNMEKLQQIIDEAEGKARERTLTAEELIKAVEEVDDYCRQFGTMKDLEGTAVWVDVNAQSFPRAYKYIPMSTQFRLVRKASCWKLDMVTRMKCDNRKFDFIWSPTFAENMASFVQIVRSNW